MAASPVAALSSPDDRDLVARIRRDDAVAFEALFKRYYAGLFRYARGYVRDREAAEDLVHDVLLRVWEQREAWQVTGTVASYLYGAVRNRAVDYLRRHLVERKWRDKMASAVARIPELVPHPSGADAGVELSDLDRALVGAIDRLPSRCRQVFVLCRESGLSYAETAAVMGISPKTVQIQMGKALKTLRAAAAPFLGVLFLLK